MTLHVWPSASASGARNMALDEAAMECARAGAFVFRTYGWDPACISFGRNQPTSNSVGGRPTDELVPGVDVVRRPTGGRAVYHGPEITYAFAAPQRFLGGPRAIYRAVHAVLGDVLANIGVSLDDPKSAGGGSQPGPPLDLDECFVAPAPGEITVGGRKLVGSAQWRHRGAVLQHGSLLLRNDQHRATVTGDGGERAIGLAELVPTDEVERLADTLKDRLVESVGQMTGEAADYAPPDRAIVDLADTLQRRYEGAAWTWRV